MKDKIGSMKVGEIAGDSRKSQLIDGNNNVISAQYPLTVDGDSLYAKDIDIDNSDIGDFDGEITDFIDDYRSLNNALSVAGGGSNPKSFTIALERPISATTFGMTSRTTTISNAKLTFKSVGGEIVHIEDYSSDNTKRSVQVFQFPQKFFMEILVEFYTDDAVNINGIACQKSTATNIDAIVGIVSEVNSTTTPLTSGSTFTGDAIDTKNYGIVLCSVYSDVDSAEDGLCIEFSSDKTNWYWTDCYTIFAEKPGTFSVQTQARYMRVKYTNGSTNQTTFRLETMLKPMYVKPSSHRILDPISAQDDAELVKAVLTGENPGGTFVNFQATTAGNFKVSVEEFDAEVDPARVDCEGGGKISVGTTAVEVTFTGDTKSILITADIDNSGYLYVGKSNVTSAGANALTFLMPGDSLELSYDDVDNALYVVGSEASQNFWKGALL